MNRRSFLQGGTGAILAFTQSAQVAEALGGNAIGGSPAAHPQNSIFVSATGDDKNPGTISRPLKSFQAAQAAVRNLKTENSGTISVCFRAGTYYLPDTIVFTPEDSGKTGAPIIYVPYPGEQVLLSGGSRLSPKWMPYRDGIMKTSVPSGTTTDQLFVNGRLQILARYPNLGRREGAQHCWPG
jgi:hypothetical protein